jgi:hypothetical protein
VTNRRIQTDRAGHGRDPDREGRNSWSRSDRRPRPGSGAERRTRPRHRRFTETALFTLQWRTRGPRRSHPRCSRLDPMFDPLRNDPRFQKLAESAAPKMPTNNATWCRSNLVAELTLQIIWQGFSRARGVVQRVCQSELLDSILSETRHVPARRVVRRHDHREKYSARPCEYLRHFLEK